MAGKAQLKDVKLPDFGLPKYLPELEAGIYKARYARFVDHMTKAGFDAAVIYADREHCANISYLTGFDPRFEEAILVVTRHHAPVIVTGLENVAIAAAAPLGNEAQLWPGFGLMGQDRTKARALSDILADAGLSALVSGAKIGLLGWKYFSPEEGAGTGAMIDLPDYLVRLIEPFGQVVNATALLMDPATGLRAEIEIEELARFEFMAAHGSEAVRRVLFGLAPGMTELEAASLMRPLNLPVCCHPMLSSGERAHFGVGSPANRVINQGDKLTMCFGYQGSLTARAGYAVSSADDLPEGAKDYAERLVAPYWEVAAQWYETIGIGVTGGEIDRLARAKLDNDFFRLALNPGHLIHIDEWMHSPVQPGNQVPFRTNQAVQLDIIPATGGIYFTSNVEDGIAILDANARAAFAERFPEAWSRIEARRAFMKDVLGIHPKAEVLPFSNLAGWLPAYFFSPGLAMTRL